MEPAAIQFCARKVASQAGDMRKALDVCRRAVEMVEADVRKQQLIQGELEIFCVLGVTVLISMPAKCNVSRERQKL